MELPLLENPPSNIEAEASCLGAMMLDIDAIKVAEDIVAETDFYSQKHAIVFSCIVTLRDLGVKPDLVTVTERLYADGTLDTVGGAGYLTKIFRMVPSAANIRHYADIIREKSLRRQVISAGYNLLKDTSDSVEFETLASHVRGLNLLMIEGTEQPLYLADDLKADRVELKEKRQPPITTGIPELDEKLPSHGFGGGELIIVFGVTGTGKTAFCLHAAGEETKAHIPAVYFSCEMPKRELFMRLRSEPAGVPYFALRRNPDLHWDKIEKADAELGTQPLTVVAKSALTARQIRQAVTFYHREGRCAIAFIDNLQKMIHVGAKDDNNAKRVGNTTTALKQLALELDIPIVLLCQPSREVQKECRRPILADLRDSGEIENDADIVLGLYHHAKYNHKVPAEFEHVMEILILKDRNGPSNMGVLVEERLPYNSFGRLPSEIHEEYSEKWSNGRKRKKEVSLHGEDRSLHGEMGRRQGIGD